MPTATNSIMPWLHSCVPRLSRTPTTASAPASFASCASRPSASWRASRQRLGLGLELEELAGGPRPGRARAVAAGHEARARHPLPAEAVEAAPHHLRDGPEPGLADEQELARREIGGVEARRPARAASRAAPAPRRAGRPTRARGRSPRRGGPPHRHCRRPRRDPSAPELLHTAPSPPVVRLTQGVVSRRRTRRAGGRS